MTAPRRQRDNAVPWLMGQSVLFGAMAALLGVVANALFLEAYGAGWLPVTYLFIGVAGIAISGAIARGSQRFDLLRIAVVVLGGAAAIVAASWFVAGLPGGAWVSGPLLVLFPILIQLGFVFIGGQAGRILDIAGIKSSFPRIMAGFPAGAVVGGVVAVPLVDLTGRTEDLLLATAAVQGAFTALVWATGRRYRSALALPPLPAAAGARTDEAGAEGRLGRTLRAPFVLLILAYQVLSAIGSQVSDYLVFDRAAAAFPAAEDLARFIGGYTALMNIVSIAFLLLVAGPLLRRFGLRLGIAANPGVLTILAVAMVAAFAVGGAISAALLAVVAAGRIADIALTDGTTRTSINATYQVLPPRPRIGVQTAVEGIGVPVAIGVSGAMILGINALPAALPATIGLLLVVCATWTWVGLRLYAAYGPALVDALRRGRLLDPDAAFEATVEDVAATRRLVASADPRSAHLGVELASTLDMAALIPELSALASDPGADVEQRLAALASLAAGGNDGARRRLAQEVRLAAVSPDSATRSAAAHASGAMDASGRRGVRSLLDDDAPEVRRAYLDALHRGDDFALDAVVRALGDVRTAPSAMRALDRLGDTAVPALRATLEDPDPTSRALATRMLRGLATPSSARDEVLQRHVGHADRALGRQVLDRLSGAAPAAGPLETALEAVLRDDAAHAVRILTAAAAIAAGPIGEGDAAVLRALEDELDLARARVAAALTARYGRDRLGQAIARLAARGEGVALAAEAIEVVAGAAVGRLAGALFDPDVTPEQRLERFGSTPAERARLSAEAWLRSIVEDAHDDWRSPWLRACAVRALRLRGRLDGVDLARATATGDPVVAEEAALATGTPGARSAGAPR